ncbi:hypothetical protein JCM11641_007091 [Rhodosporidiobolus odoratus]
MTRYYFDDLSPSIAYSTSWTTYVNKTGGNATFTFQGPGSVYVIGDYNPNQRGFYCVLNEETPWKWYNGSSLAGPATGSAGLNRTRCAISGLEAGTQYTLTFGQPREQVQNNGVTLDYIVIDNSTEPSSTITWTSEFATADVPSDLAWSTATQAASESSTTTAAPSSTSGAASSSASSGGSSNGTAVGVGVGVGVGLAVVLGLIGAWLYFRRKNRSSDTGTVMTEPYGGQPRSPHAAPMSPAGRSEYSGVVPYVQAGSVYAPTEYQSRNGGSVPEVQQDDYTTANGVTPYYSARTPTNSDGAGLDSPATFSVRGGF